MSDTSYELARAQGASGTLGARTGARSIPDDYERLVDELARANRRLAGTLGIVLGTLDSPDVGTLFERTLEQLQQTLDAAGSLVYLCDAAGLHLRGTSASLDGISAPRFLGAQTTLARRVADAEQVVCLRVLPPSGMSLREGPLVVREILDEGTHETYEMHASHLPPFASFLLAPVRFADQLVAVFVVGWQRSRSVAREDLELLDAVARYLSVQLVGAFATLNRQRREQLMSRANELRDKLVATTYGEQTLQQVMDAVEVDLGCACMPLELLGEVEPSGPEETMDGEHTTTPLAPAPTSHALSDAPAASQPGVTSLEAYPALVASLQSQGLPTQGALVVADVPEGEELRFLVLRQADEEPLDRIERDYLERVIETVSAVAQGDLQHAHERRIAQALQLGMRSQLQDVPGITAQGIYTSATASASVGGDFYDLIRLPGQRACVIMGDVSGKGVEAASVSAAVRTALGAYAWEGLEPARMVELLNDFLLGFSRVETFATLFVGLIDLEDMSLRYCSAGHPPALLVRAGGRELVWLDVQSGVVGAFHDMGYRNGQVAVGTGDVLVLYTDGTTEARALDGTFYGEEGLRDAVVQEWSAGFDGLLDRLLARVDDFTDNRLNDDVAMVALRIDA